MKKTILSTALIAGLAASALAQGSVFFSDQNNTSTSPTASINGMFLLNDGTHPVAPLTYGENVSDPPVYGTLLGIAASSYTGGNIPTTDVLQTSTGALAADVLLDLGNLDGQFFADPGKAYIVPGATDGTSGEFQIEIWTGNYTSLAAAQAAPASAHAYWGVSAPFQQVVHQTPNTPLTFTTMPAVILSVPEPGTFALAGLGAAALLIFRRRK